MLTDVRAVGGRQVVERFLPAPRDVVFRAWVDAPSVERWWGCEGAVSVLAEVEPVVGGRCVHRVALAGGGEVVGRSRFMEVDPPRRLAYVTELPEGSDDLDVFPMTVTVDFLEAGGGGTDLHIVHTGIPADVQETVAATWSAALDRLGAFLSRDERGPRAR